MSGRGIAAAGKASGSAEKWIAAVLSAWEVSGQAAVSARGLAQVTGLPASSIYHHFGDLERLYVSAHEHAQALAAEWCGARLDQLADVPAGAESLPALLAVLIDDWCEGQRGLAFAWRECQLLVARDPRYGPAAQRWRTLWAGFWRHVCDRLGIPGTATITERLFDGESFLHMMRWRRSVDRAALDELCRGWGNWLGGSLAGPGPWRDMARGCAQRSARLPEARDETAERIAEAAAAIVARGGVAGVTHRAVAAEAGLTLGVVSHKFRTSAELLGSAFEAIYRRNVPAGELEAELAAAADGNGRAMLDRLGERPGAEEFRLATSELMMAAMRDPALAPFAAQLRYLRGRTSRLFLQAMIGRDRPIGPLDAAIFSSFAIGQGNAHRGLSDGERQAAGLAETEALLAFLRGG
ncbi:TetR/AcrR family transcriptional regulator [Sphingomonas sp. NPDC092331]|jgi:AcrR family transcriptional regulator|uniref:TetR/AcrR family transcriptional regulator n=1 Tax=unclassified Sphingomonas TaxID=196159 RepID=UPI0031F5604C